MRSTVLLFPFLGGSPNGTDDPDFREVFEAALNAQFLLDADRRVRRANPASQRVFGRPPRGLEGRPFADRVPAASKAELAKLFEMASGLGQGTTTLEGLDGSDLPFPIEVMVRRLQRPGSEGYVVIVRDLRERAALLDALTERAAQLARSNRELEEFAYVASHDLQEPLRMIASYTQLLQTRYAGQLDAKADEYLRFAHDGATRMQQLVDALLAYARVDTRAQPFVRTSVEAALAQALSNLGPAIADASATVDHDPLPEIEADPSQLVQLLQNLVANAIKFKADTPPRVHVRSEPRGKDVLFSVTDNGIGILPEFQESVFAIFRRLHQREEYPGTGIGLAVCKKVVDRHGGRIWVESTGVRGRGSTFFFELPARRPPPTGPLVEALTSAPRTEADRLAADMIARRLQELI